MTAHKQKLSKWTGIKGVNGVANVKQMQELMETSDAFLFWGFGRLLSSVPPGWWCNTIRVAFHFAGLIGWWVV